jgi:adenylylsulfate kinase
MGCRTFVFDGDNVRHGLNKDLGFSPEDREENIRRISEMSKLFMEAGVIALTAFISPFREDRAMVRCLAGAGNFVEVFCDCSLQTCETRDVKGLYAKARRGEIKDFTGISSPYEKPEKPEIVIDTNNATVVECVDMIIGYLRQREIIDCMAYGAGRREIFSGDRRLSTDGRVPSELTRKDSAIITGDSLIDGWRKYITNEQIRRTVDILNIFGLDKIYSEESMPNIETACKILEGKT